MIEVTRGDRLWTVTLQRPEKANSLTTRMLEDLSGVFQEAATGPNALILTGAGKVFSAGADLDEARAGLATHPVWEEMSGALARLPCLTICAMNGTLAGGAFGMALACDLRIAVAGAKFFYPVMKLGFLPQPSDPGRLAALVGPAEATRVLMAGEKISADEALRIGLLNEICAADSLLPRAQALAEDACGADRAHVAGIKALLA